MTTAKIADLNVTVGKIAVGTAGQILTTNAAGTAAAWAIPNYFVRDKARDLLVFNNSATPDSKVDVTASEIILKDTSGYPYLASTVSVTIDMVAAVGVNALDTGAEAASTWYHIWIISDGTKEY